MEKNSENTNEKLQMMSEDFMRLRTELNKIEPFYLKVLRTLNLNTWYSKASLKWAQKKQRGEGQFCENEILTLETFKTYEKEEVKVANNSFKRRGSDELQEVESND